MDPSMLDSPPSSPTSSSHTVTPMASQAMDVVTDNPLSSTGSSLDFLTSISSNVTPQGILITQADLSKLMHIMNNEQYSLFNLQKKQKQFQKKNDSTLSSMSAKIERLEEVNASILASLPSLSSQLPTNPTTFHPIHHSIHSNTQPANSFGSRGGGPNSKGVRSPHARFANVSHTAAVAVTTLRGDVRTNPTEFRRGGYNTPSSFPPLTSGGGITTTTTPTADMEGNIIALSASTNVPTNGQTTIGGIAHQFEPDDVQMNVDGMLPLTNQPAAGWSMVGPQRRGPPPASPRLAGQSYARMAALPRPPSNRVINSFKPGFFIIRRVPGSSPFTGLSPAEITKAVNNSLSSIGATAPDGTPITVKGVAMLPSGDYRFFCPSRGIANWLLLNKHLWSHLSDPQLVTKPITFPVILHSVPTSFSVDDSSIISALCNENDILPTAIANVRWLGNPHSVKKTHGSLVVNLLDKSIASQIERGGLFFESQYLRGAHYTKSPTQCFKCLEVGHTHNYCKSPALCSKCGECHNTKDCSAIELDNVRCYKCIKAFESSNPTAAQDMDLDDLQFRHSSTGLLCPLRRKIITQPHTQSNSHV